MPHSTLGPTVDMCLCFTAAANRQPVKPGITSGPGENGFKRQGTTHTVLRHGLCSQTRAESWLDGFLCDLRQVT